MPIIPADYLGTISEGGTWSFVSGPFTYPTAPATWDGALDFSGYSNGQYIYEYEVECDGNTRTAQVTINYTEAQLIQNDICDKSAAVSTHPLDTTGQTDFINGYLSDVPLERSDGSCVARYATLSTPPAHPWAFSTPVADAWYYFLKPNGDYTVNFTVTSSSFGPDALEYPLLAIYSGSTCSGASLLESTTSALQYTGTISVLIDSGNTDAYLYLRIGHETGNGGFYNMQIQSA